MRKLYNHNKGKIHPSPTPSTTTVHHLSLLPFAIATLAVSLAPEDKEVLAYLLSCSNNKNNSKNINKNMFEKHAPQFSCNCFTCYTSYWVRWDVSPNRQLIHEIIDVYEDGLIHNKKVGKKKKEKRRNKVLNSSCSSHAPPGVSHAPPKVEENMVDNDDEIITTPASEKGSVRKFASFIGEKIWGVWG